LGRAATRRKLSHGEGKRLRPESTRGEVLRESVRTGCIKKFAGVIEMWDKRLDSGFRGKGGDRLKEDSGKKKKKKGRKTPEKTERKRVSKIHGEEKLRKGDKKILPALKITQRTGPGGRKTQKCRSDSFIP